LIQLFPQELAVAVNPVGAAGGALPTVTVVETEAPVPPGPVQLKVYVLLEVKFPVDIDPDVPFVPDQSPDAIHEVALFVEDQVKVEAAL
jgi:hypothetical protein